MVLSIYCGGICLLIKNIYTNTKYKDALFRFIFNNPYDLLSLYNAVNNTNYSNIDSLEITTLEDIVYLSYKNDVSFLFGHQMNLYEHQSSYNPNMPVRGLIYFAELYSGYIQKNKLDVYSTKQINLPVPRYIIFYNGTKNEPEKKELRLSECFKYSAQQSDELEQKEMKPCLELTATMLNINIGNNEELMKKCNKLYQYSEFVRLVRKHLKKCDINAAINLAIDEAISNNILKDILQKQRAEVCRMILTEYNEELHMKNERKIAIEEGYKEGYDSGFGKAVDEMIDGFIKEGKTKEQIIEKLISYFKMDKEKAKEYFDKHVI